MELTQDDITRLLQPFPGDVPAGEDVEYLPLYEEISRARESEGDESMFQDEMWGCEVRQTDWQHVSSLCIRALEQHGKDLQVACWLTQAQGKLWGLAGIDMGLRLITGLCESFWPTLWPQLDEEGGYGAEMRLSRLNWLDKSLCQVLDLLPLTDDGRLTMTEWARCQHFEHTVAVNGALRASLESDGYFGMDECNNSIRSSSAARSALLISQTETLQSTLQTLQERLQTLCDEGATVLTGCRKVATEMLALLMRFREQATPAGVGQEIEEAGQEGKTRENKTLSDSCSHHDNRTQAVAQILNIAGYFRRNEPTSPVPYLLERAARWANMGMAEWLDEMLEDNSSALREIMRVVRGPERIEEN